MRERPKERERERDRDRDRQTDRQRGRDRDRGGRGGAEKDRERETRRQRHTERQTDKNVLLMCSTNNRFYHCLSAYSRVSSFSFHQCACLAQHVSQVDVYTHVRVRGWLVGLLVPERPSNMLAYLRDGSAQTVVRVATMR